MNNFYHAQIYCKVDFKNIYQNVTFSEAFATEEEAKSYLQGIMDDDLHSWICSLFFIRDFDDEASRSSIELLEEYCWGRNAYELEITITTKSIKHEKINGPDYVFTEAFGRILNKNAEPEEIYQDILDISYSNIDYYDENMNIMESEIYINSEKMLDWGRKDILEMNDPLEFSVGDAVTINHFNNKEYTGIVTKIYPGLKEQANPLHYRGSRYQILAVVTGSPMLFQPDIISQCTISAFPMELYRGGYLWTVREIILEKIKGNEVISSKDMEKLLSSRVTTVPKPAKSYLKMPSVKKFLNDRGIETSSRKNK